MDRGEWIAALAVIIAGLSFAWTIFRDVTGSQSAERSASAAQDSARAAEGSKLAAERSAAAAEEHVNLERERDEATRRASLRPLYWNSRHTPRPAGLIIQNEARGTARSILGYRFMPGGRAECAEYAGAVLAGETVSIEAHLFADVGSPSPGLPTQAVPDGHYLACVTWVDDAGQGESGWMVVDKR